MYINTDLKDKTYILIIGHHTHMSCVVSVLQTHNIVHFHSVGATNFVCLA